MKVCNEIKRRIDEADQAEQPGLEISRHTAHCVDCRRFAQERVALRALLGSGARVSVPMNFDAMLNARLAEVKAQKTFSWLSPAAFLRMGAATAALAVMFFAAQTSGLFSNGDQALSASGVFQSLPKSASGNWQSPILTRNPTIAAVSNQQSINEIRYSNAQSRRVANAPRPVEDYVSLDSGGVILVRGQNGEHEMPVPTVSLGAQPLLYSSRPSQSVRSISVSF